MTNSLISKSALLRASALAGGMLMTIPLSTPVSAATVSQINIVSIADFGGGRCRVIGQVTYTGTVSDPPLNSDRLMAGIEFPNGLRASNYGFLATGVGQTSTNNQLGEFNAPSTLARGERLYVVREADGSSTAQGSGRGAILASLVLPRADLIAAGGGCANSAINQAPVVSSSPDATLPVQASTTATSSLTGSASDPDGDAITTQWVQVAGPNASIASPNSLFTGVTFPALTQQTAFVFELRATDAAGDTSVATTTFTLQPPNNAPTADAGPDVSTPRGVFVPLDGTGSSDPDNDPLTYSWQVINAPSNFWSLQNSNQPTNGFLVTNSGTPGVYTLELTVEDGLGGVDTDTVDVTITNAAPTFSLPPDQTRSAVQGQSLTETLALQGSVTDPENDSPFTYQWNQTAGPAATITTPTAASTDVTLPAFNQPTSFTFELTVADAFGASSTDTQSFTIVANQPPQVDAGPDQTVAGGSTVSLTGTATDPDNDPLTFQWIQASGTPVTINNANSANASFTAPPVGINAQILEFEFVANDGGANGTDVVVVTVPANQPPNADITGPSGQVAGGSQVTLDGSGSSDPEGQPLIYQWSQVSGPSVSFTGQGTSQITYTAPASTGAAQSIVFQLLVADPLDATDSETFAVTVAANTAPVANASQQSPTGGSGTVQLDGSASFDPDGDPITYQWSQTSGPAVTLSDPASATPSFTLPAGTRNAQSIVLELVVNDGSTDSAPASVTVTVPSNAAPIADAGIDTGADGGASVTLDATGSTDPEGDALTYAWTQISGPAVTLDNPASATPSFTAPAATGSAQAIVFEVLVSDGATGAPTASQTDQVTITVAANQPPSADAGSDQSVNGGAAVTLDGSASTDPDGDALTYTWTQVSGPAVALSDANAAQPSFTAPAATASDQPIVFNLTVSDGVVSASDEVTVTILANRPPVADAGADQGPIDAGQTVTLNGSGSSDPDNDTLTYSWVQTGGPSVTLANANSAQPTFTAPQANDTVRFELTVSDGIATATDTVSIEVRAVGSITIVQRITGTDTEVTFTSSLAALSTSLTTTKGSAEITAQSVPVGTYSVTASDLTASGIAITDITCSDTDSFGDVASRTATIELAAGEEVTCTFTAANSREAAQVAIYNFLTGRNALILANQPDLQRRIDRLSGSAGARSGSVNAYGVPVPGAQHLPIEASIMPGQARFSSSLGMALSGKQDQLFDIWAEAYFSRATIGNQDADFSIVHVGADLKLSDSLLIGAIVQFDDFTDRDTLEAGEAEGEGFMAGPYITAKLAPQFFVEARAAWGTSDNIVSPLAGQRDAFETNRSLYSGSLVGQLELGKRTTLRPELTLRYLSEDQKAYTDSLGIAIPSQTVDQGDLSFRPRLSHVIETQSGFTLRPFAEVEGIYTFGTAPDAALASLLPGTFADTFGQFRGRVEGGIDFMGTGAIRASLSGFYDGIGADGFSNRGVHLGVSFGF